MKIQTSQDVGKVWMVACAVFVLTVISVRMMGHNPEMVLPALCIGYLGLAVVGLAIFATGKWAYRYGPASSPLRVALYVLIPIAGAFWILSLVFPFL